MFTFNDHFLGDIDRLKEYTVCCFEYLLAKIHGISIGHLMWEFDIICKNILDVDVLLVNAILTSIMDIVSRDPILLAGEMILRLKTIKHHYHEYIESLFTQAHDWCESSGLPVFVPLSSWMSAVPSMITTVLPCFEGAHRIAPTSFNQHVFTSTSQNEIAMYHIPSKKLVKKLSGMNRK
jgi:NACHT domain- and WD repeat-containing protein